MEYAYILDYRTTIDDAYNDKDMQQFYTFFK